MNLLVAVTLEILMVIILTMFGMTLLPTKVKESGDIEKITSFLFP